MLVMMTSEYLLQSDMKYSFQVSVGMADMLIDDDDNG